MKSFSVHFFRWLGALLRDRSNDPPTLFGDPPIGVRQPRNSRPGDRTSAVAVPEPDDDRHFVEAIGQVRQG
jgi:hypothetical protein